MNVRKHVGIINKDLLEENNSLWNFGRVPVQYSTIVQVSPVR